MGRGGSGPGLAPGFFLSRPGWRTAAAGLPIAIGLVLSGLAACADLGALVEATFPAAVPGLPAGQGWTSLPLSSWLVEGGIEARAVSACADPGCPDPAVVGLFTASGPDAILLARLAEDPAALRRGLLARMEAAPRRRGKPRAATRIETAPLREGALAGVAIRLARADGAREAAGVALAARRGGTVTFLLVIAATPEAAGRIARAVAPHIA